MTRVTGSDCAVMCNLINTHTCTHAYIHATTDMHPHCPGEVCRSVKLGTSIDSNKHHGNHPGFSWFPQCSSAVIISWKDPP